ncbi:MAG: putative NEK protein kinase [Streblomastix strix]|uniref:non-specific serine/threonine protein kinase n=1 Tax=Streblomastix strix TaxID=222440 RepID=A0A5J4VRM0_9EUKA|nr:MAG: putative NEK protein kinase [Streblomastix strix]
MQPQKVSYDSFEVIEELEGGAQGRTFYVKLIETGVPYAMKRINYMKKSDKERAEKEIAQMKKLESKFTVRLVYTFQDRTDMFLVTEYCENGDLRKVITELQQVPEEERVMRVWAIFGQMIRALEFLHCNGVIHRDIKPANIFVMIDGSVRLGDFGLARDVEGDYYLKEEGTKVYMAAEVFKFKRMDYSTDIFAIGIVTTELLTGHHPFQAPNELAMIEKIKSGQHSELPEFVPKELKELITAMLSLDSKRRPTTKQIMQQSVIKMYLRMQEEKERMQEEKEKQQNEIALLKQQLSKKHHKSNTSQTKQQSISTKPKVTSEPKIMIEPPVTQATVTQVRNVLSLVESEVLQDVEVNGDTYTNKNHILCTLLYNPVMNKGIVKLEVLRVKYLQGLGIADESVRYGRNEWPWDRGKDKIVYYQYNGDIQHNGSDYGIGGNSGFSDGCRIGMELNMESNPRSLTFFIDDKEQPNFIINIPKAVRIFCYIPWKGSSFKIIKFEFLSTPTARHGEGSRALEYGKYWKR